MFLVRLDEVYVVGRPNVCGQTYSFIICLNVSSHFILVNAINFRDGTVISPLLTTIGKDSHVSRCSIIGFR